MAFPERLFRKPIACLLLGAGMFTPQWAAAVSITAISPNYTWSVFPDMPVSTRALAFGSVYNAVVADVTVQSAPVITLGIVPGAGYGSVSGNVLADTTLSASPFAADSFLNGLAVAADGTIFSSESLAGQNAGIIRQLTNVPTPTILAQFSDYRPTGLSYGPGANLYYTARKASDPGFGGVYRVGDATPVIGSIVGTGLAVAADGSIFVSTPGEAFNGYLANSIYRFYAGNYTAFGEFVSTLDSTAEELSLDPDGHLIVLGRYGTPGQTTPTLQISAVPVPGALWLFGSGLAGLAGLSRKRAAATGKAVAG